MKKYSEQQVRDWLFAELKHFSQRDLARRYGVLESRLSEFLSQKRGLSDTMATAIGFERLETAFVRKQPGKH